MAELKRFLSTVSCRQHRRIVVGEDWFYVGDTMTSDGQRKAHIFTPWKRGSLANRRLHRVAENERVELFSGVFVTCLDAADRTKVKVLVEAAEGIPVFKAEQPETA